MITKIRYTNTTPTCTVASCPNIHSVSSTVSPGLSPTITREALALELVLAVEKEVEDEEVDEVEVEDEEVEAKEVDKEALGGRRRGSAAQRR
jgi:hypothetical protein